MVVLLDVNVLIALFDPDHAMSDHVAIWFTQTAPSGWATCAITENGFVRIMSQQTYPHPVQPHIALTTLKKARTHPSHQFWNCDISVTDTDWIDPLHVLHSSHVTDVYLLGLAVKHNGCFVTLDQRIARTSVKGATQANLLVL